MKLKICGMKYQDNIGHVANLLPDYLGFIFHEPSLRHFDNSIPELPKSIKKVGVFVDEGIEFINRRAEEHKLDCVQLHGHESPETCRLLKTTGVKIIKVFAIKNEFDFSVLDDYENACDFFLFDTKGRLPGGNGYTFDWNVLNKYPSTKPFFLSGGIGMDQVEKLKEFMNNEASKYCYALDVNSKFEIEPGLKDIEALNNFKKEMCHFE